MIRQDGTIKGSRKVVYRYRDGDVLELDVPHGAQYAASDNSDLYMWEEGGERISYLVHLNDLRSWEVRRELNGEEV